MKKFLLLLLLASSLLAACDKSESDSSEKTETPVGDYVYKSTGNVINYYFYPDNLSAGKSAVDEGPIYLLLHGFEKDGNRVKTFKEYANYYGDTAYFQKLTMGWGYTVSANPLTSINVTADKDFDSEHPAGSSLNDILSLKYASAYNLIQSGYDTSIHIYNMEGKRGNYEVMPLSKLDNVKLLYHEAFLLFDKQPDVKGKYNFEITLNFDKDPISGKELKLAPVKVEFEF